jgi:hypothetical protein
LLFAVHTGIQPLSTETLPGYVWTSEICQPSLPFCGISTVRFGRGN